MLVNVTFIQVPKWYRYLLHNLLWVLYRHLKLKVPKIKSLILPPKVCSSPSFLHLSK